MAKNGASLDYKFGPKNNWRRWAWNRVTERLGCLPKDAVVIYLAGAQDLDRNVALERGFLNWNLIACESSTRVVQALRDQRVLTIHGDLFETLLAWPHDVRVAAVIGDFCGGLSTKMLCRILQLDILPHLRCAVLCFNWLRGRELDSQGLRELGELPSVGRHRGQQFWHMARMHWAQGAEILSPDDWMRLDAETWRQIERRSQYIDKHCSPCFHSYRSGAQVFDSIVYRNLWSIIKDDHSAWESARSYSQKQLGGGRRRKVAATLAHRTMRRTGSGPYSRGS
jgi:hypothetical protein